MYKQRYLVFYTQQSENKGTCIKKSSFVTVFSCVSSSSFGSGNNWAKSCCLGYNILYTQ